MLPTLNEEEGLDYTLRELLSVRFRTGSSSPSILVVDGRSTDRTRGVAESWGVPVLDQRSKGKGAAVREGLEWARGEGFDTVAVMDADGTYPASSLPAMFHLLDSGRHLVVGVRRPEWSPTRSVRDMVHRIGNGLLNYAAAQFTGQPVLDICSGFWGVRTEAMGRLSLRSDGFEIESELFLSAFRAGMDVAQFPIVYRERVGTAKLHAVRDGARILMSIVRHSLKPVSSIPLGPTGLTTQVLDSEDLDSLLLSLAPRNLVFVAAPDRLDEAREHARRIMAAIPQTEAATRVMSLDGLAGGGRDLAGIAPWLEADGPPAVVVTLLPADAMWLRPDPFLVEMPWSRRLIRTSGGRTPNRVSHPSASPLTAGFHRERIPAGRMAALFILSATVESSGSLRELALVAANGRNPSMEVYRRSQRRHIRSARGLARLRDPIARLLQTTER